MLLAIGIFEGRDTNGTLCEYLVIFGLARMFVRSEWLKTLGRGGKKVPRIVLNALSEEAVMVDKPRCFLAEVAASALHIGKVEGRDVMWSSMFAQVVHVGPW